MFDEPLPLDMFFAFSVEKYYKHHESCIGKDGDFITAPEVSQMFCHAVGAWIYSQINNFENKISLVELGGGYGTLMNEILNLLQDGVVQEVYFVETSPKMIAKQKKAVSNHIHIKFYWVGSIQKIPSNIKYIVIANEFFDALPVKQFIYSDGNFRELYVSQEMQLIQSQNVINNQEMQKIMQYSDIIAEDCNEGDILEVSTVSLRILDEICKIASAALIIDYGYSSSKKRNTIKAIENHIILDSFLVTPGRADISVEVDFGVLQRFIKKHYSTYAIYHGTQREFLIENHIEIIANKAKQHISNPVDLELINSELHKITVEMGEFRVLSFNSA